MTALNDCGCCEGLTLRTPVEIENRAGLSAIAYRVGTHAQFKASMLTRLSGAKLPELGNLKTREDDDFTIALLDAWALVSDILTFYQERIANESYLRTATERASIIQLARLIGYELRPGVAASTYLAFTLETGAGAPGVVPLAAGLKVQSIPGPGEKPQTFETVEAIEARPEWNVLRPQSTKLLDPAGEELYLAGVATNLKPGDPILITGTDDPKDHKWELRRITTITADNANDRTLVQWKGALARKKRKSPRVYALRLRASLFGANAQDWEALPVALRVGEVNPDPGARTIDPATGNPKGPLFLTGAYATRKDTWADKPLASGTKAIHLDAVYNQIAVESWIALESPDHTEVYRVESVSEEARSDFNISAKTTRLGISGEGITNFTPRSATVFAQSEELTVAATPITTPVAGERIELDRLVEGLESGRTLLVSGISPDGETVSEVASLEEADVSGERTVLEFATPLAHVYERETLAIFANVAYATHGESVIDEVLGSGDSGTPYQKFTLKRAPLTYTPAPTASGGESTLEVRVNDLRWAEVETLFGRGPRERIYITTIDDDGTTTVQFGDGHTGARLPKGQENVTATYRKGIGLEGLVDAGQLSLLMTRPLGVRSVINPMAPAGAQDPQDLDDARENAPLTVLTLDRIVSLRDYQDFARTYSGIAKALAVWTWSGHSRGVFITVAGIDGAEVADRSTLQTNLLAAMRAAGDEFVPIVVRSYRGVTFKVVAGIRVDPDFIAENVLAAVESALRSQFSFDARAFGQPVALSEVIAVMQNVAGVVAVDVNQFHRSELAETRETFLPSRAPDAGAGAIGEAAELLTLHPGPLELTVSP